ncbi:DUF1840 domain-containing protein [Caenimonas sp. SL110]|uniref:DUF1840 domain-containing protein n=1 Tax=Caenimonas sp. SL110 TaxID=1450524 RepID=UPI0006545929|nr:DUF1840 domain-containing protein [Caenimonas sp. SL110]
MLYKFKSKAAGDVIMLEPNGKQVLQLIGKDAGAKGIIEPSQMHAAIAALESAIAKEETDRDAEGAEKADGISLKQRALPLIDMMRRAKAADEEIVWGV